MEQQSGQDNRKITIHRVIGAVILLFAAGIFGVFAFFSIRYFGTRPILIWEYGEPAPLVGEFSRDPNAIYAEPPSAKPEKGWHTLTVETRGRLRKVLLYVRDTTAPKAQAVEMTISSLQRPGPDELVTALSDADRVKLMFGETPPFGQVGDYQVPVILEDVSGNRSSVTSLLHIRVLRENSVVIEAGAPAPEADAFLLDDYKLTFMTEITDEMRHTPGEYPIEFEIDGSRYRSTLTVRDTVAPVLKTRTIFAEPENTVTPEDFIVSVEDETETKAEFLREPDYTDRNFQSVSIRVTDAGGNTAEASAGLLLTHSKPVVIEARKTDLTAGECLQDTEYAEAVMIKAFTPDVIGMYAVSIQVDGRPELALVEVRDTTPPLVTGGKVKGFLAHPMTPESMCKIDDATDTTAEFEKEPDWNSPEPQSITILVTDAAGNRGGTTVDLVLEPDTEPPVLYGIKTKYYYVDEAIQYLEGIEAVDNADGPVPVRVDASKVTQSKTGRYTVVYTATDAAGNTASKSAVVWIKKSKVKADRLDGYVQKIMAEITTEDMTLADKVFAIYDYVFTHVRYSSRSDKTDWRREALRGIQRGRGDCYTSNSLARALLETTEAEIFIVQRKSYNTHHYWLLVNIGTGWYHFDATNSREHGYKCCMWTNAQCSVMRRFWTYDISAAPPVATERFDREKAAAVEAEWVADHQTGNTIDVFDDELIGEENLETVQDVDLELEEEEPDENDTGVSGSADGAAAG